MSTTKGCRLNGWSQRAVPELAPHPRFFLFDVGVHRFG